jgi:hypothetical protein
MSLLVKPKLLILDEMGYLSLDSFAATCLFQLVSERYENGSIILTSNKSYGDWGAIFADNVIASAILDRLLHHSTTINIKGESYRLKDKKKAGVVATKLPGKDGAWPQNDLTREHAAPGYALRRILRTTTTRPLLGNFQAVLSVDFSVDDDNLGPPSGSSRVHCIRGAALRRTSSGRAPR